jgi:ribosomal protein L37E
VARTVEPIRAGERVVAKTPDPMELHMGCRLGGGHDFYGDSDICSKCGLHGKIIRMLTYKTNNSRASELADECGKLRQENLELLAENARLRRQLERVKR